MKNYQIELKRTSYVNLTIEAENEAKALAWRQMEQDQYYRDDGAWDIESIELDDIATDETRSYGPRTWDIESIELDDIATDELTGPV
jgi:hypothetical protein